MILCRQTCSLILCSILDLHRLYFCVTLYKGLLFVLEWIGAGDNSVFLEVKFWRACLQNSKIYSTFMFVSVLWNLRTVPETKLYIPGSYKKQSLIETLLNEGSRKQICSYLIKQWNKKIWSSAKGPRTWVYKIIWLDQPKGLELYLIDPMLEIRLWRELCIFKKVLFQVLNRAPSLAHLSWDS